MDQYQIIKLLSDEVRFKIVMKLMDYEELYVSELVDLLQIKQANASKHLKKLREADIVDSRREKNMVMYTLNEAFIEENLQLIKYLMN
jgi:ArsR family transcriptional regulator